MTKEQIENRIKEIEKAMQQCMANFNLLEGGKRECLYWLETIDKDTQDTA